MLFSETKLQGVFIVECERICDERGFFARSWCQREFEARGLVSQFVQCNISFNARRGTLRGMHYQAPPHEEIKLIRCTRGAIYDVLLDVRPNSTTYKQWIGAELSADNYKLFYVPGGIAHGFQTLTNEAEVFYQMSEFFHPESSRGARWDDAAFGITWPPAAERIISERDQAFADFREELNEA